MEISDRPGLDDPLWGYVLESCIRPYIPRIRKWWLNVESYDFIDTGISEIIGEPAGLYCRFTRTPVRSTIKGIQAFPFIPTSRFNISGVQGGIVKMIARVCLDNKFKIDEFTVVCKTNQPFFNNAQIVAIIPTKIIEHSDLLGRWIYFTQEEIQLIAKGEMNDNIRVKAILKA